MASITDIANLALQHLGESRIQSIEDTDKVSTTLRVNYDQSREESLEASPWTFALELVALSKLVTPPVWKWGAAYQLPSDYIRLYEIDGDHAWYPREYFAIKGRKLLIGRDEEYADLPDTLNIEYVKDEEDTSLYSPAFVDVVAKKLAMKCARTLTGSDKIRQQLMEELEKIDMPAARTINGQNVYSGKNHPVLQVQARSFSRRARRNSEII